MRIPWDRLPPGFAETVTHIPDEPAEPRPAATVVLMRKGDAGDGMAGSAGGADASPGDGRAPSADANAPEILLLRRVRSSGFVPGAWVFPGGRVDHADADPALLRRVTPADAPARLAARLGVSAAEGGPARALGYVNAALREAFEETGIPVGWAAAGAERPDSYQVDRIRARLLNDELTWLDTLEELDIRIDTNDIAYLAHWVTPVQEPRRYDARFFLAEVPRDVEVELDPREMSDAIWLTPEVTLERHAAGELPMVFPTIRTIESLRGFESVTAALEHFRDRPVPRILPRLVAEEDGVRMVVE